jgi:hypothetical protein
MKCTGQRPTFGVCVPALSVAVTPAALALTLSAVAVAVAVVVTEREPLFAFPAGWVEIVLEVPIVRVPEFSDEPPPQAQARSSTPIASAHEQQRRVVHTLLVSTFAAPAPPAHPCALRVARRSPRGETWRRANRA